MSSDNPPPEVLVEIYRKMTLLKQNDERFRTVLKSGEIIGNYYSPRGQEAIPSAVSVNLRPDDYICTIYRGIHDFACQRRSDETSMGGTRWPRYGKL